jgi:dihydrofolate reductase
MARLVVFNQITLDGYFSGPNGDLSWAHEIRDPEVGKLAEENAMGGGRLLFGRVTYEMMKSYWPTPAAAKDLPVVARQMNSLPKYVFSRSMDKATWENTTVLKGELAAEVRKLKAQPGQDLILMGSGSIVAQLTQEALIDEYQLMVFPVVLGKGRTMFEGVKDKLNLKRTKTRNVGGNILLCYEPARRS